MMKNKIYFVLAILLLVVNINFVSALVATGFDYPVGDRDVTQLNDGDGWYNARDFGTNNHLGEDWNSESGGNSDCNAPVYAIANGQVVASADYGGNWGNVIIVRHTLPSGNKVESLYGHLNRRDVTNGNNIRKGQQIGTIGDGYASDGCSGNSPDSRTEYWAHVHLEIRYPNSRNWGQSGPGYSTDSTGWTDPSNFITSNRNIAFPVDKTLIQKEGDPPIYWLQNNIYYWILDEATFNRMIPIWQWGNILEYEVNDFNNGIRNNPTYRQGSNFTSDGLLLKKQPESTVYLVENNQRRAFFNYDALIDSSYGFNERNIIDITQTLRDSVFSGDLIYAVGYNSGRINLFRDAFNRAGGANNLGYARNTTQSWGTGQIQYFKRLNYNSAIVYNPNDGNAYPVYGAIYTKYTARGANIYGFPIGDENWGVDSSVTGARARYQRFGGGSNSDTSINHHFTGSRAGLTVETHGPILDKWALMNYGASCAGLPISDVYSWQNGLKADFENGYIYWDGAMTIASCEPSQDECTQGTTRCSPTNANVKQTCGNYDADIWLEWGNDFTCSFGCSAGQCNSQPTPTCSDGIKNQDETDIDCGGRCGSCANGRNCLINFDCQSNYCNPNRICSTPSCTDGWQNQNEEGVDCGGPCQSCRQSEANDDYTGANILNLNSQGSESVNSDSDKVDWWYIPSNQITQTGSLTVTLDNFRTNNQDFDIYVYSDNLEPLCSSLFGSSPVEECRINTISSRSYYIKVDAYSGSGSYQIRNAFLIQLNPPGVVTSLRERMHSENAICIEWDSPTTGGQTEYYAIRENIFSQEIIRPVREFCRADFPANTDVRFEVKACNTAGCSAPSAMSIRTDQGLTKPKITGSSINSETVNNQLRVLISGGVENLAGVENNPDFNVRVDIISDITQSPINSGTARLIPVDSNHANFEYTWIPNPSHYGLIFIVKVTAVDGNERGKPIDERILLDIWSGKKICIDPGHGGSDPGNLGFDDMVLFNAETGEWRLDGNADKPNEADFNLLIAQELRNMLDDFTEVNMTRDTDTFVELFNRTTIANNAHCDIFVSVHQNAANTTGSADPEPDAHGTETYYKNNDALAKYIHTPLIQSIQRRDRGVKYANFFVLRNTQMPSALIEVAFSTNDTEFNLLNTQTFRRDAALGIFNGIRDYFARKGEVKLKIFTELSRTESPFEVFVNVKDSFGIDTNEINGNKLSVNNFDVYLASKGIAPTIADKQTFSIEEISIGIYKFTINPVGHLPGEILDLYITAKDPSQPEGQQIADIDIVFNSVVIGEVQCNNITGGDEVIVNTHAPLGQTFPSIAMNQQGSSITAWQSYLQDGSENGIFAQRFDSNGNKLGNEFQANTYTAGRQGFPAVAINSNNGNFIIAWQSSWQDGDDVGIFAQRFDSNGNKLGPEFQVNTYTTAHQILPKIVMDSNNGNFVITWSSWGQDGSSDGIYARRFDNNGNPLGNEFLVNTNTASAQMFPSIAIDSSANFVITWQSLHTGQSNIYAQRFNSNGDRIGGEFLVNSMANSKYPNVAMDSQGNFILTWRTDWPFNIYAKRFDNNGNPLGNEFQINTYMTFEDDDRPVAAINSKSNFVILWHSWRQDAQDRQYDIIAKNFKCAPLCSNNIKDPTETDTDCGGSCSACSDGKICLINNDCISNYCNPNRICSTPSCNDGWQNQNEEGVDCGGNCPACQTPVCENPTGGSELTVNTHAPLGQTWPAIAMDFQGNFIAAWNSYYQDGSSDREVYAQRFDSSGNKLGGEFRVNTYTNEDQEYPSIAMDVNGNFVITWMSYGQQVGSSYDIYAQRFDSSGNKLGGEFRVNTYTNEDQTWPAIAMDSRGNFVITWFSYLQDDSLQNIYAQRFDSSGNKLGGEFRVNTYLDGYQADPAIAMDSQGNFVITWGSAIQDGSDTGVYAQRFDSSGNKLGGEFRVNTYTLSGQRNPVIVIDSQGNFVITWGSAIQDGSDMGVYAQRFDSSGNKLGGEFRVNTYTLNGQENPSVAMDSQGNFVITWRSYYQDGTRYNIYAQRFDVNGNPLGNEFKINTYMTDEDDDRQVVAMGSENNFVILWHSWRQDAQDRQYDVMGRIFKCLPLCSDGIKDPTETDLDCGGVCTAEGKTCANGKICSINNDCQNNYCNPDKICSIPLCTDGWQNGNEVGIDCGGVCPACDLQTCGNNIIEGTEECDDNNLINNDGCSATCNLENVPFLVTIFSPENKIYATQNITFNFSINKPGACLYSLNNGRSNSTMTANTGNTEFTAINTTLRDGSYTVRAYCNDTSGNRNDSVKVTFSKDTRAPRITIRSPALGFHNISMISLQAVINEPGICNYSLDNGRTNNTMQNTAGRSFSANTALRDGSYIVFYYCVDVPGNLKSAKRKFYVDTIFPRISYGTRTAPNNTIVSRNWIYIDAVVNEINQANITFSLSSLTTNINSSTFTNKKRFINFTNLNPGVYAYNVSIVDKANNKNATETRFIQLT